MTGRPDAYMPFYVADYLGDTGHLCTIEHGAYILLIFHYWRIGEAITADDKVLARIARLPLTEWDTVRDTVRAFFEIRGDKLVHARIEAELLRAKTLYAAKKQASIMGNAAKRAKAEARLHPKRHRLSNRVGNPDGNRLGSYSDLRLSSASAPAVNGAHSLSATWNDHREKLAARIREGSFNTWFSESTIEIGPPAIITVAKGFQADYIRTRFAPDLMAVFGEFEVRLTGDPPKLVAVEIDEDELPHFLDRRRTAP